MAQSNSKIKPVYFNLNDEEELILYQKTNDINNFSKWVKRQLRMLNEVKEENGRKSPKEIITKPIGEETISSISIQNIEDIPEIDMMMI